jgi:hypothetical protein
VPMLWSVGETGKHQHRRVRIVADSRVLSTVCYVLRTTHGVVITQMVVLHKWIV